MDRQPLLIFGLIIYFIPSIVAASRLRTNTAAIFVLNLFLGWTVFGWVLALVWAVASENRPYEFALKHRKEPKPHQDTRPCPFCAEQIQNAAILCRFCGATVEAEPEATGRKASPYLWSIGFLVVSIALAITLCFALVVLFTD